MKPRDTKRESEREREREGGRKKREMQSNESRSGAIKAATCSIIGKERHKFFLLSTFLCNDREELDDNVLLKMIISGPRERCLLVNAIYHY